MVTTTSPPDYRTRAAAIKCRFDELPRGARAAASHDLRLSASVVSGVLNGKIPSRTRLLDLLEEWVDGASPETIAWSRDDVQVRLATARAFAEERLEREQHASLPVDGAWDAFVEWCGGEPTMQRGAFIAALRSLFPVAMIGGSRVYVGIRLREVG